MTNLDEWSTLEGEYLSSLSGVIDALVNASLQLPVGGNVQVDVSVYLSQHFYTFLHLVFANH